MFPNRRRIENRFDIVVEDSSLLRAYDFLELSISTYERNMSSYLSKDIESDLLIEYAKDGNMLYGPIPFSNYVDEGAEQKVFYDYNQSKVIKINDGIFYVNWSQYLESLLIHNILFPETSYQLIGFVVINSSLYTAVEQDYIIANKPTDLSSIRVFMQKRGFELKKRNDYINPDLGLIIEDLHEENVLTRDDVLFFIDTVIYLK